MGSRQKRVVVHKRIPLFLDTNNLKNENRADILKIPIMNVNTTNEISFKLIVQFSNFLSELITNDVPSFGFAVGENSPEKRCQ